MKRGSELNAIGMSAGENADLENLRIGLATLWCSGVETRWQQRAYSSEEVRERVGQLQILEPADYAMKLKVAGFTVHPESPIWNKVVPPVCTMRGIANSANYPNWPCRYGQSGPVCCGGFERHADLFEVAGLYRTRDVIRIARRAGGLCHA